MSVSVRALVPAAVVGVGLIAAGYVWSAPGTLAPPAGPIEGTGRTLDEVYDRIESVEGQLLAASEAAGPWQALYFQPTATTGPQEIVSGRVLLHAVSYYNIGMELYDGPGAGGQLDTLRFAVQSGGAFFDATVDYDVVIENGLYVSFPVVAAGSSNAVIFYKQLDPA